MRAAIFCRTGGPEVLEIAEIATPVAGPGEVLVRVAVTAVQQFDTSVRAGRGPAHIPVTLPTITGNEFAGVVAALGDGVTGFAIGERVAGRHTFGCAAEYLAVPAVDIASIPESVSFAEAAYLGGTGQTAHMAVEWLGITQGEVFLVHGGSGGVGSVAIQLALAAGARVIATGSPANQDYLRGLGAVAITYGEGLRQRIEAAAPEGVTAVLDCAGGEGLDISIAMGTDKARIATIADLRKDTGVQWPTGVRNGARLKALLGLAADGVVKAHIRQVFPLEQIAEAHRIVEAGHGAGKIVVEIG